LRLSPTEKCKYLLTLSCAISFSGKQLGRPRIDPVLEKRIQAHLRGGKGIRKIARECGVGTGTVQRVQQEMKGPFDGVAA
jgi:DNA invertase Pin-like site-specific DNA recombinase